MFRTSLLVICVVLAASTFSEAGSPIQTRRKPRIVQVGPQNAAAHVGSDIILACQTTPGDRTQWIEFITSGTGGIISDNGTISGSYPRYFMNNDHSEGWYNLTISPAQLEDGGRFRCQDEITLDFVDAEVVVQHPTISCTNTIQANNVVILGVYYTMNCVVTYASSAYIAPSARWTGPGDFNAGLANGTDVNGTKIIQTGVSFIAQKNQDGQRFTVQTYYESRYFDSLPPPSATNVPDLTNNAFGPYMFVQYGPWNMSYTPVRDSYEISDVVTCQADARPLATYRWINMQTAAEVRSQTLVFDGTMVGTYTWRCEVTNSWGTQNIFSNFTVNPITTPTPTTPSTTTTPVPAVSNCKDLSGKWFATRADGTSVALCLYVDTTRNGAIQGYLQNNTNSGTLIVLAGQTRNQIFDETGLVGIWQDNAGVSALAIECHNCYGTEQLIVDVVSRTEEDDVSCGDGGTLRNSEQYTFSRGLWDVGSGYCFQ